MGLNILLDDFEVKLNEGLSSKYEQRKQALESLEHFSKAFFDERNLDEVVIEETPFANPTWVTLSTNLDYIKQQAEKYCRKINHIIIGNGGSIEPALAIYRALIESFGKAKLIPVDSSNPDDECVRAINTKGEINKHNAVVYAISKSGNTLNTILQALVFMKAGYTVVPITDNKPSTLKSITDIKEMEFIEHTDVGGRFTANQPNALVPVYAAAMHNDIEASIDDFVKGLNEIAQVVRPNIPINENIAKQIALLLYKAELAGYNEIYMPVYSKKLMGLTGIITQQVHETYGKNDSGQTILAVEGPECQHHTNQRFFGGQKNMVAILVGVENYDNEVIADVSGFEDVDLKNIGKLGSLQKLKFSDLLKYERLGVYETAKEKHMPIMDIVLDRADGNSVGKFMGLIQGIVMYSAFLRGNRWEDQPAVEDSRNKTIEMSVSRKAISVYSSDVIRV